LRVFIYLCLFRIYNVIYFFKKDIHLEITFFCTPLLPLVSFIDTSRIRETVTKSSNIELPKECINQKPYLLPLMQEEQLSGFVTEAVVYATYAR
jgi:hypothetical protein